MRQDTRRALLISGVGLALLMGIPLVWGGLSGWQGSGWGMMGPGMMGGFGWMGFGAVFMVAFWGLIIWAVAALFQGGSRNTGSQWGVHPEESALEILKRRYAQGDISKEEYEGKRKDLV